MKSKYINPILTKSVFLLEMDNALLNMVADIINSNSYWIHVTDLSHYQQHCAQYSGSVEYVTVRCITLEVKRSHGKHSAGQRWQIPIIRLDEVLSEMKTKDAALRERCRKKSLTIKDVEDMILKVTYGIVNLEMSDDLFY